MLSETNQLNGSRVTTRQQFDTSFSLLTVLLRTKGSKHFDNHRCGYSVNSLNQNFSITRERNVMKYKLCLNSFSDFENKMHHNSFNTFLSNSSQNTPAILGMV